MINNEMENYFLAYLDDELSIEEKASFEEYLRSDAEAKAELESMQNLMASIHDIPEQPLPEGFEAVLHERLIDEKNAYPLKKGFIKFGWWKPLAAVAVLLLFVAVANSNVFNQASNYTADSSANRISGGYSGDYAMDESLASPEMGIATEEAPMDGAAEKGIDMNQGMTSAAAGVSNAGLGLDSGSLAGNGVEAFTERKVIKNTDISIETLDYDLAFTTISTIANKYGGYVVSGYTNNNEAGEPDSGYLSIRVESNSMEAALIEIRKLGDKKNETFYGEDVTSQYIDIESRLKQYRVQEERLLTLFEKAVTVSDMLTIESELSRVRGELESLEGQIRYLSQVTDLALINVNIIVPQHVGSGGLDFSDWHSFWQKLASSFIAGITFIATVIAKGIFALGYILPILIILAVVLLAVWLIIKRVRKKD